MLELCTISIKLLLLLLLLLFLLYLKASPLTFVQK